MNLEAINTERPPLNTPTERAEAARFLTRINRSTDQPINRQSTDL
jgi:hypothetical protein